MTNPISRFRWLLLAASVVAVAAVSCQTAVPKAATPSGVAATRQVAPRVGSLAPDFSVYMLTGETVRLSDLRGKPVFVNFWASWCPPCREEAPLIQAAFQDKRYKDVVFLTINRQEDIPTINQFMRENGYTFPVALDPDLGVENNYQVYAIPESFFIGTDGVVRVKKVGAYFSKSELENSLNMIVK